MTSKQINVLDVVGTVIPVEKAAALEIARLRTALAASEARVEKARNDAITEAAMAAHEAWLDGKPAAEISDVIAALKDLTKLTKP